MTDYEILIHQDCPSSLLDQAQALCKGETSVSYSYYAGGYDLGGPYEGMCVLLAFSGQAHTRDLLELSIGNYILHTRVGPAA